MHRIHMMYQHSMHTAGKGKMKNYHSMHRIIEACWRVSLSAVHKSSAITQDTYDVSSQDAHRRKRKKEGSINVAAQRYKHGTRHICRVC
jgi:hypothetical protein